jgi:antibiotic biosynthesis monooxygenase (ABM) superfamily enzyme
MATALFCVKATITKDREEAFNRWYNQEHCPQVLRYPGAVSARRYRAILGEDKFQYMALYEFQDEPTLRAFLDSPHFKQLVADYNASFGGVSERARSAYTQVWP